MARRSAHDAQVDPFNAGEPTLPWDDPAAFDGEEEEGPDPKHPLQSKHTSGHASDAEARAFSDEPYDSPTKALDNYQAPDTDESHSVSPDDLSPHERKRIARAKAQNGHREELKHPKNTSRTGKARRSCIGRIIIFTLIISLIPDVLSFVGLAFSRIKLSLNQSANDNQTAIEDQSELIQGDSEKRHAETECKAEIEEYFGKLLSDRSPQRTEFAQLVSEQYEKSVGFNAEELGIDARALIDWAFESYDYEIDSCYVFEDGTANLYFNTWCPSIASIINEESSELFDYLSEEGAFEEDGFTFSESQKEHIRTIHARALSKAPLDNDRFSSITLARNGDTWTVDVDAMDDEIASTLGLWK